MKTIVHSCSSVLIRPNGIVRYINAVIDLQKSLGHTVIFVTDAKPTQQINADKIVYLNEMSTYVPDHKDGHVWLQVSTALSNQISQTFNDLNIKPDMVIAHDLHSYLGLAQSVNDGIFIQHESDVLFHDGRYSYLSDEYRAMQVNIVNTTSWRVGMTALSDYVSPQRPIYTPVPFTPAKINTLYKSRELLYIGDASDRKGAKEFMDMARQLEIVPTVITHEVDSTLFAGANLFSFTLDQKEAMFDLMQDFRVAYIPSKNECLSLAVLECLQFMPVVVNGNYSWTKSSEDLGIIRCLSDADTFNTLSMLLVDDSYNRILLDIWSKNGIQFWTNLST